MKNKKKLLISIVLILVIVSGYLVFNVLTNKSKQNILKRYNLQNLSSVQLVNKLEAATFKTDENASIFPNKIELTDSSGSHTVQLKSDKFYVSIAPYINMTHV